MNITLELQELDELIIKHTAPPITTILRNKLHPLREQMEAYISSKDHESKQHGMLAAEHAALKDAHAKLQAEHHQPSLKHHRGLYFKIGDPIPFCPHCWESTNKEVSLGLFQWKIRR
jgi:hypothetical protein